MELQLAHMKDCGLPAMTTVRSLQRWSSFYSTIETTSGALTKDAIVRSL